MAKRPFQLNEQERQAFREAERHTRDGYELKRLQAVRLYGSGVPSAEIQRLVGCAQRTIRHWSQRYGQGGLEGLQSQWRGDNALKLSRQQRADLKSRLQQYRPDQGLTTEVRLSQGQFWSVSDLQIVVKRWSGVTYATPDSDRHLLAEARFSYQHTETVYRSRPDEATVADFEAELEKK